MLTRLYYLSKRIKRPLFIIILILVLFFYITLLFINPLKRSNILSEALPDKSDIIISGKISQIEYKEDKITLKLSDVVSPELLHGYGILVYISNDLLNDTMHSEYTPRIGQQVIISGTYFTYHSAMNEGQFDQQKYYMSKNIIGYLIADKLISYSASYNYVNQSLHDFRLKLENTYSKYLSNTDAGTLSALLLGDKSNLDAETKFAYQNAGISHILALSGLHIATLGLMLVSLLKRVGLNKYLSSLIATILMLSYAIMTGMSVSTKRALIMFFLGLLAVLIERTYDMITGSAIAAIIILFENPYSIFDNGFQLSFAAVMGIGLLHPAISDAVSVLCKPNSAPDIYDSSFVMMKIRGFKSFIASSVIFSFSIQLATLPLTMYSFCQIPVYSIILNLIVIPVMSVLLITGIALSILGTLSLIIHIPVLTGLLNFLSTAAALVVRLILKLFSSVCDVDSSLPGNIWVCGKPSIIQIVIYYVILIAFVWICSYIRYRNKICKTKPKGNISFLLIVIAFFVLIVRPQDNLTIKCMYVGQGDCTLIYGNKIPSILVDGGSSDIKEVGKYNIIPVLKASGIRHLDYIFISHTDSDHISGIREILSDSYYSKKISRIILPYKDYSGDKNYDELIRLIMYNHIPVYYMTLGQIISDDYLNIECISPSVKYATSVSDVNETSLVLYITDVRNNYHMIFTGDIGTAAEDEILNSYRNLHADYLKIAHHGSSGSSGGDFLKSVSPKICSISAGINNSYGHPHKETLTRLSENVPGALILRTDERGQITLSVNKNDVHIHDITTIKKETSSPLEP